MPLTPQIFSKLVFLCQHGLKIIKTKVLRPVMANIITIIIKCKISISCATTQLLVEVNSGVNESSMGADCALWKSYELMNMSIFYFPLIDEWKYGGLHELALELLLNVLRLLHFWFRNTFLVENFVFLHLQILKEACRSTTSLGLEKRTYIPLLKSIPTSSQLCSKQRSTERNVRTKWLIT